MGASPSYFKEEIMKNLCVAYMRYSSDNQHETSIEYQRAAIQKYCAIHNFIIVHEYIDRAQSATTDQRVDFQKMMSAATFGTAEWSRVIVYDLSRFSRNMSDATKHSETLCRVGIELVSVTEYSDNTPEGRLMRNIKFSINQFYSDVNSMRTHDAQRINAEKAKHCGGIPPLGYELDGAKKLVINEHEAEAVRKIFSMFLDGYSYKIIAKTLNDAGYTTKVGAKFTKNSFCSILRQEKYTGTYLWNRASSKFRNAEGATQRNSHRSKPEEEIVKIPGGCPAIISLETFQKVQERLHSRTHDKPASTARRLYVLGGLGVLKCGVCGRYMVGVPRTCRGKSYTTYACPNHKGSDAVCPTKEIPADALDKLIVGYIVPCSFRQEYIPTINKLMNVNADFRALEYRKRGIDKKIQNVTKSIELRFSETLVTRLEQLEKEKEEVEEQLKQQAAPAPVISKENLKDAQRKLYRFLLSSPEPEARELLRNTIKEIRITNETVSFSLNVA